MSVNEKLRDLIRNMPQQPGVYRYYDADGVLLYIGKARNLLKRVASYFVNKADHTHRIRVMVSRIRNIEFTVVNTEYEALLLENSLIKKYQPRYNVNLKDDKTYPWIVIRNERFPRVYATRNPVKDGSEYYGPYANVGVMKSILDMLRKLFMTRSCNLNLTPENIAAGKFRVCLDYHIGLCKGPCEAHQDELSYMEAIQNIRNILKGNVTEVQRFLSGKMSEAVDGLNFEEAQRIKERADQLEKFKSRSTVVNPMINNVDVFSIHSNEKSAFINYLKVISGAIITTDTIEIKKRLDEDDPEILIMAIVELRSKYKSTASEIIVPFPLLLRIDGVRLHVPKLGDKRKLLDLSKKNALFYYQERLTRNETNKDRRRNFGLLQQAQQDLGLKVAPYHIECFDNSNFQGSFPVASIVVFKNGVPARKEYRRLNVKTVEGPDDFATMEESVFRRYRRQLEENQPLPNLIIIDGGKGQLSSAVASLDKLGIRDKVEIISIAKRLEEIYKPGDPLPLHINKKSPTLKLIQRCRDAAHENGIVAHRKKRLAGSLQTALEDIPGIGKKTADKLLTEFRSVKKIQSASFDELAKILGRAKAEVVHSYFIPDEILDAPPKTDQIEEESTNLRLVPPDPEQKL